MLVAEDLQVFVGVGLVRNLKRDGEAHAVTFVAEQSRDVWRQVVALLDAVNLLFVGDGLELLALKSALSDD